MFNYQIVGVWVEAFGSGGMDTIDRIAKQQRLGAAVMAACAPLKQLRSTSAVVEGRAQLKEYTEGGAFSLFPDRLPENEFSVIVWSQGRLLPVNQLSPRQISAAMNKLRPWR